VLRNGAFMGAAIGEHHAAVGQISLGEAILARGRRVGSRCGPRAGILGNWCGTIVSAICEVGSGVAPPSSGPTPVRVATPSAGPTPAKAMAPTSATPVMAPTAATPVMMASTSEMTAPVASSRGAGGS
jgi:hypothetical protein